MLKRILPKTLLVRSMMILILPILLVQLIVGVVFWDRHWAKTTETSAKQVAGSITSILRLVSHYSQDKDFVILQDIAQHSYGIALDRTSATIGFSESSIKNYGWRAELLSNALHSQTTHLYTVMVKRQSIVIEVLLNKHIYSFLVNKAVLFPKTTSIVIWWEIGAPLFFMLIAIIFMRNQIRPLRFLADAVEDFGKGGHSKKFKPSGAIEVRKVGYAFNAMRTRIKEQISHRTMMLSGISHDLKTPLTRMQLQIAMLSDKVAAQSLLSDVQEMEIMVEEYLSFARGQETEIHSEIDVRGFIESIASSFVAEKLHIDIPHHLAMGAILVKKQAMKRAIKNIIANAMRYAGCAWLKVICTPKIFSIIIEDNGPGIPDNKKDEVFLPFVRVDKSRNSETGGYGLGLAISKDIIASHGGTVFLSDSLAHSGLKVTINLPR